MMHKFTEQYALYPELLHPFPFERRLVTKQRWKRKDVDKHNTRTNNGSLGAMEACSSLK